MKHPFLFTTIRYIHDSVTQEFANVGIVVFSKNERYLKVKTRSTYRRLSQFFLGMKGRHFVRMMKDIQRGIQTIQNDNLYLSHLAFEQIMQKVLPKDDSALQWNSKFGSGVSVDLDQTLERLFARHIIHYDEVCKKERRNDHAVWQSFCNDLVKQNFLEYLEEIPVETKYEKKLFKYTLKKGKTIHCFDPISFDLADASSVLDKAHKLIGSCMTIAKYKPEIRRYLLIGPPEKELRDVFFNTMEMCQSLIPQNCTLILEDQKSDFLRVVNDISA